MTTVEWKCETCGLEARVASEDAENVTCSACDLPKRDDLDCIHRGDSFALQQCMSCGDGSRLKVFGCSIYGQCTIRKPLKNVDGCCHGCKQRVSAATLRYVKMEELIEGARTLTAKLHGVDAVAGVTRSGMVPASMIATLLHVPLMEANPAIGIRPLHGGWRIRSSSQDFSKIAVVDDTVATGYSMSEMRKSLRGRRDCVFAAVFVNPPHIGMVDEHATLLGVPHFLEWNLFNSIHFDNAATDFDGILCEECPPDVDDDGERYADWMIRAKPLHLPRRSPVKLIVTARLEKYRHLTESWLDHHGVQFDRLVMGPWRTLEERRRLFHAGRFKGEAFAKSTCGVFVESCPQQSRQIADVSGKSVICPASGQVF
jgi:uncharacterized HAD superfamily protein